MSTFYGDMYGERRKRFGLKLGGIVGVAAVIAGGCAAAYAFSDTVKNQVKLAFSSPQDYFTWVCEKNADDFSEAFHNLNSKGYKVCFKLSIDEGAITYHVIDKDRKSSIYKYSSASHLNYEEAYQMINSYSFRIPLIVIGSPLGLFNSVSDGIISGFRKDDDLTLIQFTAPISHGSSGGALLNTYGEVIGITTSGTDRGENINFAVSYEQIRQFASNFIG